MKEKRIAIFTLIAITLLFVSCNFNLFDGGVTATYKSIPNQEGRYKYAKDLKDGGDQKKLEELIPLLKADVDPPPFFTEPYLSLAKALLGNIYFVASGFSDLAAGLFANLSGGSTTEDAMLTSIVDTDGDGTISTEELNALLAILNDIGTAADYLNDAATTPGNETDSDLQLQNAIAQIASCMDDILNTNPTDPEAAINAFVADLGDGTLVAPFDSLNPAISNAEDSLNNIPNDGSTNYDFAQLLLQLWLP